MASQAYFAGFILVVSIIYVWKALSLRVGTLSMPGPGFLPLIVGTASAIIAGIILISSYVEIRRKIGETEKIVTVSEHGEEESATENKVKIILFIVGVIIYISVINSIGYLISTFGLMLYLLWVMGNKGWWRAVLLSTVCAVMAYVVFGIWLKVPLPKGIIGL